MNLSRTAVILLCAIFIAGFAAGIEAAGDNAPPAQSTASVRAEDLLAVAFSLEDMRHLFRKPGFWWPSFPEFNTGLLPSKPGERLFVVQNFKRVGPDSGGEIENALILFDSDASARHALKELAADDAGNSRKLDGPPLGDESCYFSRFESDNMTPYSTTVRFRVGAVLVRLTLLREMAADSTDRLARYAAPIVDRAGALLKGELHATPIPAEISAHMPRTVPGMELLGATVIPVDAWALNDTANDPLKIRGMLQGLGGREMGFARYRLQNDPAQVVELTLFTFPHVKSATRWVREFIDDDNAGARLDAGRTGVLSAFVNRTVPPEGGGYENMYELQFAKGTFVGDVSCYAPYAKTSSVCEEAVRELAESWFGELEK